MFRGIESVQCYKQVQGCDPPCDRYDMHFQIDFRGEENEDAELHLEIWDWDRCG